jgi:hypothetical protein
LSLINDVAFINNQANLKYTEHSFNSMPDLSDLSINRTECPRCGAAWLNGQLYWATGCKGKEEDLAGLVCNMVNTPECINPKKGVDGGDTWEKRRLFIDNIEKVIKDRQQPGWDAGLSFEDN